MPVTPHTHEISASAGIITAGVADWIRKINEPFADPERATYDYRLFIDDLKLPYTDTTNENGQRAITQHDQLAGWTIDFLRRYDDLLGETKDAMLGRQIFCTQTYIAQLFRMQTMLQATDEADYLARLPQNGVAGINLAITIDEALRKTLAASDEISVHTLADGTTTLNNRQEAHVEILHQVGHLDAGETVSGTVVDNLDLQAWWTGLVVEYVVFGAKERDGELAAVPVLDPASTDAEPIVYFPFET
ncbi:MAG TPA: hypothetical protein VHB72_01825 [Candidatus Saccharimonadales bacterium]|nr:hypothetical protein [Candidatus Saccharimonadales bacterium]